MNKAVAVGLEEGEAGRVAGIDRRNHAEGAG